MEMLNYENKVSIEPIHQYLNFDWHNQKIKVIQNTASTRNFSFDMGIKIKIVLNLCRWWSLLFVVEY